jgi:hypothetical protein
MAIDNAGIDSYRKGIDQWSFPVNRRRIKQPWYQMLISSIPPGNDLFLPHGSKSMDSMYRSI